MIVFYITSAHSCRVNWGRPLWKGPLCRVHSRLAKSSASAFKRSYRQHLKDIHWGFPFWKTPLCRVHSFVPNARSSTALVENLPRFVLLSAKHFDINQPTISWSSLSFASLEETCKMNVPRVRQPQLLRRLFPHFELEQPVVFLPDHVFVGIISAV